MTVIKLTNEQQARLVQFAIDNLLGGAVRLGLASAKRASSPSSSTNGNGHPKAKASGWSAERRARFARSMAATWARKRKGAEPSAKSSSAKEKSTGAGSKSGTTAAVRARRAKSARILAAFNQSVAMPSGKHGKSLGPLVRRGYLKKHGDGYLRTGKAFEITR